MRVVHLFLVSSMAVAGGALAYACSDDPIGAAPDASVPGDTGSPVDAGTDAAAAADAGPDVAADARPDADDCARVGGYCMGAGAGVGGCAEEPFACPGWTPPGPQPVCCIPRRCGDDAGFCWPGGACAELVDAGPAGECQLASCCAKKKP